MIHKDLTSFLIDWIWLNTNEKIAGFCLMVTSVQYFVVSSPASDNEGKAKRAQYLNSDFILIFVNETLL